jgi:hypothetical protein
MPDTRSDNHALPPVLPWFERIGAGGFAAAGAVIGLALSLLLVSTAATEAPAASARQASAYIAAQPSAPTAAPIPAAPEPKPAPVPTQAPTQLPIPAEQPAIVARAPAQAPPPQAWLSVATASDSPFTARPTPPSVPDRGPPAPTARAATATCSYITASGEPCRNPVSGGGFCHLHRAPDPAPSYSPSTGGTVHVRGYYRKDGTYVRPHTRSSPRRR